MIARYAALLALVLAGPAVAQSANEALARADALFGSSCRHDGSQDILVCGGRGERERQRLPFPTERTDISPAAGDIPRAIASRNPTAPCGIFEGQRRCGKAEALKYGYGGGRDPLTAAVRVTRKLLDGDAELGSATAIPDGFIPPL